MICDKCGKNATLYNGLCHACLGECRLCHKPYNGRPGWNYGLCPECKAQRLWKNRQGKCLQCGRPYDGARGWSARGQYCPTCHAQWKKERMEKGCVDCGKTAAEVGRVGWLNGRCPYCVNKKGCRRCGIAYDGRVWNNRLCPECLALYRIDLAKKVL